MFVLHVTRVFVTDWSSCDVYDNLPLCSMTNNTIFAISGGLSPNIHTLDEISMIDRCQEVPDDGALCDLLWSGPETNMTTKWAGHLFGEEAVN